MKRFTGDTTTFENLLLIFRLHIGGHLVDNAIVRIVCYQYSSSFVIYTKLMDLFRRITSVSSHIKAGFPQTCEHEIRECIQPILSHPLIWIYFSLSKLPRDITSVTMKLDINQVNQSL